MDINKCSHFQHNKKFDFLRVTSSGSVVLPSVQSEFVDLAKYSEFPITSTSTHATNKSEDIEGIQIQIHVARHASSH
jgi:hypothetical protein